MLNPFEIFEIPVNFKIDKEYLSKKFIELQKLYHPDNFINSDVAQKTIALNKATDINQSYKILLDPIRRAISIIELNKGELEVQSNSDMEFLMSQMEKREYLDSILDDLDKLEEFEEESEKDFITNTNLLEESFKVNNFEEAKSYVDKLQFIQKLTKEIQIAIDKLD
ncbi:MAG: Fe-S protein assembly co-chaperone HscB [Psittacicella sp.]